MHVSDMHFSYTLKLRTKRVSCYTSHLMFPSQKFTSTLHTDWTHFAHNFYAFDSQRYAFYASHVTLQILQSTFTLYIKHYVFNASRLRFKLDDRV